MPTADDHEIAHLVPLSLCWHYGEVIVATEARSRTARNAQGSGQARLALGLTQDVVMIDAAASVIERSRTNLAIRSAYLECGRTEQARRGERTGPVRRRSVSLRKCLCTGERPKTPCRKKMESDYWPRLIGRPQGSASSALACWRRCSRSETVHRR